MSKQNAIRTGRAFVELFADDSKLVRGLRLAEKRLKAFGDRIRSLGLKIAGLGTAMLAPLAGAPRAGGYRLRRSRFWSRLSQASPAGILLAHDHQTMDVLLGGHSRLDEPATAGGSVSQQEARQRHSGTV